MSAQAFAIFDLPIGTCGIAWNAKGIAGFQLRLHALNTADSLACIEAHRLDVAC